MDLPSQSLEDIFNRIDGWTLVEIALVALVAVALIWLSGRLLTWLADRLHGRSRLAVLTSVPVTRLLIVLLAVGLIIPLIVQPSVENMVALLGATGLALGFALKDYVSSLIAGLVVLVEFPYRQGDWVEIDGQYGEVKSIGARTVELVTPEDTVVVIPHSRIWTGVVLNANDGGPYVLCVTNLYADPACDAATVRDRLHDVALSSPYLLVDKPIAVMVSEEPWGTHFRIKAYPVDPRQQFAFVTDLTVRGRAALADLGIAPASAPAISTSAGGPSSG